MLFTKKFLNERVKPDSKIARKLIKTFTQVYVLWNNANNNGQAWTEEQTEEFIVQPELEVLGWSFAVQVKMRDIGDVIRPDYTLFLDSMSRALAESAGAGSTDFYSRALAVAEAKHWNRSLGMRGESQRDTWKAKANPDHQMIGYLKSSKMRWGVLTNGSVWRLYHHSASSTATDYFEVNLSDIYKGVDPAKSPGVERLEQFYIWWQIFQCNAFLPDGAGLNFIDHILEDYVSYKNGVIERLTDRIVDEAIPAIAEGILLHRYQKHGKGSEAKIDIGKLSSAIINLVYRMFFLLVGEHQGLLPGDEKGTQVIGLCTLANSVLDRQSEIKDIYAALINLFRTVYYGDFKQHIPPYRGDLFNPNTADFEFLQEHKLSDSVVQKVIIALTVDGKAAVDFDCFDSDLLAYLSEVLLDASLNFVDLPLGRRELRATVNHINRSEIRGKYDRRLNYPPIDYLIHQTLKSVLDEKEKIFYTAMDEIVEIRTAQIQKTQSQSTDSPYQLLSVKNNHALEAWLNINVLDPCMRTGRTLIAVIQYLTKEIICRMQVYHDLHPEIPWDWNPIYVLLDQERKRSLARISRYGLEVNSEEFGDTRLLRRVVALRCVYGVEADPSRLDIAKHNIWLATFSVGSPFNFLDHHLRRGNAIMGTKVSEDYHSVSQQIKAHLAEGVARALKKLPDTESQLYSGRWNAQQYEVFRNAVKPYQTMLDLSILGSLEHPMALDIIKRHSSDISAMYLDPDTENLLSGMDFFHWDLEFPEIFLEGIKSTQSEDTGFEAVISVPDEQPWREENWQSEKFLKTHFSAVEALNEHNWYYIAQGLRLITLSGYVAVVIDRQVYVTRQGPLEQVIGRLRKNTVLD